MHFKGLNLENFHASDPILGRATTLLRNPTPKPPLCCEIPGFFSAGNEKFYVSLRVNLDDITILYMR